MPHRPYKEASIEKRAEGWAVMLDGKPARTPQRRDMIVPLQTLAETVAAEFNAQPAKPDPKHMPCTQFICIALDIVAAQRIAIIAELLGYGETDLLCHRAEAGSSLRAEQDKLFTPLLLWVKERFGIALQVAEGIMPAKQPEKSMHALEQQLQPYDDFTLAGLSVLVKATGSLFLGLAALEGKINAKQAIELSQLEERYSLTHWGGDVALENKLTELSREIAQSVQFIGVLTQGGKS